MSFSEPDPDHADAERIATLRALLAHVEAAREEERRTLARELHDDLGTTLTALSIHLQGAYALFPDDEKSQQRKAKIQSLLAESVATTRRLQTRLRPTMLELFGLKTAIAELMQEFGAASGLQCRLSLPDEDVPYVEARDIALYRMLQAILENVATHARASRVELILDLDLDDEQVQLTVRDDGIGIASGYADDDGGDGPGHGLRALRERCAFLGGRLDIRAAKAGGTSGPGGDAGRISGTSGGTSVTIRLPLTPPAMPAP